MKNYSQFIKEEIDLRGNKGIPDDFMSSSNRQAERNLGVRVDDERQMHQYGPQIMQLISRASQMLAQGVDRNGLQQRITQLETLAKNVILQEYEEILSASAKPVELEIKMINPGTNPANEIPELRNVPARPNQNQNRRDQQDLQNRQQQQNQQNNQQPGNSEEVITDDDIKNAVDKKKLLNVLTQGEAKATKAIIQFSDLVEPGLREIFGNNWNAMLNIWLEITEVANKIDWIMPLQLKSQMMKDMPQGMAGACQVKWEKDEESEEGQEGQGSQEENENEESENFDNGVEEVGNQNDFDRITIKAVGVDFPMLIHETIKGIYLLLQSGAIKPDAELAKLIAKNTSSFEDESQDFRYGVPAQAMFRDFINACRDADRYSNMNARVYAQLALDKDNGGSFTDAEFLETTKSLFASFDLVQEGGRLEFILNQEKFAASTAKRNIELIISRIVEAEREYEEQMREWEAEQALGTYQDDEPQYSEEDNDPFNGFLADNGMLPAKSKEQEEADANGEYTDDDLRNMRKRDIQELVDDALDAGDYKSVERYMKYLGEGKEIYERELQRINESHSFHSRRKK